VVAIWYVLFPAALNFALGGALGWWFYRFAELVPIRGSAGAVTDTLISSFLVPFMAWFFVAPGVQWRVRNGFLPARRPSRPLTRFARMPALLRALAFGAAGLALVGAPASLALLALAPESLSLPAFLGWKASVAALVAGLAIPAIAWSASDTAMVKAIPRFPVLDLRAALHFYETRLGFQKLFVFPGYAGVGRGDFELHLFEMPHPDLPKWTSCRVNVVGIDALYAEYSLAGVIHPNGALATQPWGFREFTALDPCGNAIVFGERVAISLSA
jgi:catechol 2,3-dioxygenase-like lactoylglutathione lyase family enzyme